MFSQYNMIDASTSKSSASVQDAGCTMIPFPRTAMVHPRK